nr:transposase [Caballeronia calidae]
MLNLQDQLRRIDAFEDDIDQLEKRTGAWQKQEVACRAISDVPSIRRLTATALVATIGDARTFRSGREFAAFLGLVPRQSGTGGKIRLGSISKRGDPCCLARREHIAPAAFLERVRSHEATRRGRTRRPRQTDCTRRTCEAATARRSS